MNTTNTFQKQKNCSNLEKADPELILKEQHCHVCNTRSVTIFTQFEQFGRVTSDCKIWASGGNLGVCNQCGIVQKITNVYWEKEINQIYSNYDIYHQAIEYTEQLIFNQTNGFALPRSKKILNFLINNNYLSKNGCMLDVGCGTGTMLRSCSHVIPDWELNGFEPNIKNPEKILSIPKVNQLFTERLDHITQKFDFISVIHTLEHIKNPIDFLINIRNKLTINGIILIQIPNFLENPFDILITDHCSHFDIPSLLKILPIAGLKEVLIKTDIIEKEITIIAKMCNPTLTNLTSKHVAQNIQNTVACINWVKAALYDAREIANKNNFGIFGTSIAATWLLGELQNNVTFFVDEDETRTENLYYNKPVYKPQDVADNSHVYVIMPPILAKKITKRLSLKNPNINFYIPPPFII